MSCLRVRVRVRGVFPDPGSQTLTQCRCVSHLEREFAVYAQAHCPPSSAWVLRHDDEGPRRDWVSVEYQ